MKLYRTKRTEFVPLVFFPLATVSMLLLAFFLLSSRFVLQPGITLCLPNTSFTLPPQANTLFVTIAAGNPPRIFVQDTQTTVQGFPATLAQHTGARPPVVIRADRSTHYDVVLTVADVALSQGFAVAVAGSVSSE